MDSTLQSLKGKMEIKIQKKNYRYVHPTVHLFVLNSCPNNARIYSSLRKRNVKEWHVWRLTCSGEDVQ
jgi:hypothetical protein